MTWQPMAASDAASAQNRDSPNAWQRSKSDSVPSHEVYMAAYELAERKLSGQRLADAKQWIYRQRRNDRLRALIARLEPMPDLDGR